MVVYVQEAEMDEGSVLLFDHNIYKDIYSSGCLAVLFGYHSLCFVLSK